VEPEKVVIVVIEEHVAAFAGPSTSRVVFDVVCCTATSFCCCRVEFGLVYVTPKRTEVKIVVSADGDQVGIN